MKFKFDFKKILNASVFITVIAFIANGLSYSCLFKWLFGFSQISFFQGMTVEFLINSLISSIVFSLVISGIYDFFRKGIPLKGIGKGVCFTFCLWLAAMVSGMYTAYVFINIEPKVAFFWLLRGLIIYVIFGFVLGFVYERKK